MALPRIIITDEPSKEEPDIGHFAQISDHREEDIFDMLQENRWAVTLRSKVGGTHMPHVEVKNDLSATQLLEVLNTWSQSVGYDKFVYMTPETARILIPVMSRPSFPFQSSDTEVRELCVKTLGFNLKFDTKK